MSTTEPVRDLQDGLILRWANADDRDRIAEFNAHAFREEESETPLAWDSAWIRELMSGRHPLVGAEDFVLVQDSASGAVVSSACLMWQRWQYEEISFEVGRPEHVATDPNYRNRGLVRALFAALHERSAARGQPVQAITGIPYFYRQFGYEYALDLEGGRIVYPATIPDAPTATDEAYRLRDATVDDIPFMRECYERYRTTNAVSAEIPEAYWHYAFAPFGTPNAPQGEFNRQWRLRIITDRTGADCGYVRTGVMLWGDSFYIWDLVTNEDTPLRDAALPTLRALRLAGVEAAAAARTIGQPDPQFKQIMLCMECAHPLYTALGDQIAPLVSPPYAWYVRVPDLPHFLQLIAPVLERRLAASPMAAYSGEMRINFYRGGLRLTFERGKLTAITPWQRPIWGERQHASFPPLVFLQLLFGRRSLAELSEAYPDVRALPEASALLEALFPKRSSRIAALD